MLKNVFTIYIERFYHKVINTWIANNLRLLTVNQNTRGLLSEAFIYLPDLRCVKFSEYLNPRMSRHMLFCISSAYKSHEFCQKVYDLLIRIVQLDSNYTAAPIKIDPRQDICHVLYTTERDNARIIKNDYLSRIDFVHYGLLSNNDCNGEVGISEELALKISEMTKNEDYEIFLKFLSYVASQYKHTDNVLLKEILERLKHDLEGITWSTDISSLYVDKHYRIWLPDYNNIEIILNPLPKAVYLLFLQHPEGLRFKQLIDFKEELMLIYGKLSNRMEQKDIERSIDDLINPTSNSLNEKCSRIKDAFVSKIHLRSADYYILTGDRGGIKRVKIASDPRRLVYKPIKPPMASNTIDRSDSQQDITTKDT